MKTYASRLASPTVPSQGKQAAPQPDHRASTVAQRQTLAALAASPRQVAQRQPAAPNRTGLPDKLKAGVESLSGHSLDDVRVHHNSTRPAQLQALAYAQGTDIHVAPGQEKHLPHEAWHVAQQKQGRVRATTQLKSVAINDDATLEQEADRLGSQALRMGHAAVQKMAQRQTVPFKNRPLLAASRLPAQRVIRIKTGSLAGRYETTGGRATKEFIVEVEKKIGPKLRRGWKQHVGLQAGDDKKRKFPSSEIFQQKLLKRYKLKPKLTKRRIRPGFPSGADYLGKITLGLQTGKDQTDFSPSANDAALPHRFPYASIQASTKKYLEHHETSADLTRWSDRLLRATEKRRDLNKAKLKGKAKTAYVNKVNAQITRFTLARSFLIAAVDGGQTLTLESKQVQEFLKWTNGLHGNIPDYGPHTTVNIPVSDRLHLHFKSGELTPGSQAAGAMTPTRTNGLAVTQDGKHFVTTDGEAFPIKLLTKADALLLSKHKRNSTTLDEDDLDGHNF